MSEDHHDVHCVGKGEVFLQVCGEVVICFFGVDGPAVVGEMTRILLPLGVVFGMSVLLGVVSKATLKIDFGS